MPTLKLRIIIIILPTDEPKIILSTAHTTKKIKLPLPYCNTKEINFSQFYYTCYLLKTLLRTQTNLHEFHLYCCDHVCKVNEWSLVYCFHSQFSVSTQIMQGVN